ncbi:MAG: pseudouridine synthase [Pseudomonadota bacterium]|nr:pseudouridine synthase [Pseudomonadota bacterium]
MKRPEAGSTPPRLLLLNKPCGVLSQFSGEPADQTLRHYLPLPGVYAAGRLDRDSEGLLLLTGDGTLQARISGPRFKLTKRYLVQVEGAPTAAAAAQLVTGVALRDGPAAAVAAQVADAPDWLWPRQPPIRQRRRIPTGWLRIELDEGRNRQVRRMTAAVGLPTLRLIREQIGPLALGTLAPGQWRAATAAEFRALMRAAPRPPSRR